MPPVWISRQFYLLSKQLLLNSFRGVTEVSYHADSIFSAGTRAKTMMLVFAKAVKAKGAKVN